LHLKDGTAPRPDFQVAGAGGGGTVSERNGDKSRFGRIRKEKVQRRKLAREARIALETKRSAPAGPGRPELPSLGV